MFGVLKNCWYLGRQQKVARARRGAKVDGWQDGDLFEARRQSWPSAQGALTESWKPGGDLTPELALVDTLDNRRTMLPRASIIQ